MQAYTKTAGQLRTLVDRTRERTPEPRAETRESQTMTSSGIGTEGAVRAADQRPVSYECRNLTVEFRADKGTRRVLEDLEFDIRKGEFVSILGTSGAGKTTLLRVLGGLLKATPQSVLTFHGKPVSGPPERVVTVFQDYGSSLLPWRTVRKNVALGLERKVSDVERNERVEQALEMVGLTRNARDYPWQLSGGMQQRVQIARALAVQPSVLLMDEPFGALDAMTKASLQDELCRVHEQTNATIVFITHDIEEAVYLSDRILILKGVPGRVGHAIDVDLPRPRHQITTKEMPEYLKLRHRIYEAFGDHD